MGIDYGTKRVGIALSDESGNMAFPHSVIPNTSELLATIQTIVADKAVQEIVIGHSLDREGVPNAVHESVEELLQDITLHIGVPVHLEPEQYTTQAATRIQGRNDQTDAAAAALILDSFLMKQK